MRSAILVLAILAGCSTDVTAVLIDIDSDPSWGVDRYEVRIGDHTADGSVGEDVRIVLSDQAVDQFMTIGAWGMSRGVRRAYGAVEVMPKYHQTVQAEVHLSLLQCESDCDPDTVRCHNDGVAVCELDADGCYRWGAATPCPEATPACSNGSCAAECVDECTGTERVCDGAAAVKQCGQNDADACRDWLEPTPCGFDRTCEAGVCVDEEQCTSGTTTVSGTVFAPNQTLPLPGVDVYVPVGDPGPLPDGAQCTKCGQPLAGGVAAQTRSGTDGRFVLTGVPAGQDIPLIIQTGKWRRRVVIPQVDGCADNPLPATMTSLPRSQLEGDMPRIAVTTGACDAYECLLRRLGIADSEFTSDVDPGRVHLYTASGASSIVGANAALTPASILWNNVDTLRQYDLTMMSCECSHVTTQKPKAAMDAVKAYADLGGRIMLSHYNHVWIVGDAEDPAHAPEVWPTIARCDADGFDTGVATIDTFNNANGGVFSSWMLAVMGSTFASSFPVQDGRQSCVSIDETKADRWTYVQSGQDQFPQNFMFTTPNEHPAAQRCGKVLFSDLHVASGSSSTGAFPTGCSVAPLTPQEKALAFMMFDLGTCVP